MICACSKKQEHIKADELVSFTVLKDTFNFKYKDSGRSTFMIKGGHKDSGYDFQSIETNYKLSFLSLSKNTNDLKYYIAKYTTITEGCTGCEGHDRSIQISLHSFETPNKTELTIEKECDEIMLGVENYKTTKYGCCGTAHELAIYDYQNRFIIGGDEKILLSSVPNSKIKFYLAWKINSKDENNFGTLYIAFNNSERYAIQIKDFLSKEDCSFLLPDIKINTGNAKDKFREETQEYILWSLNKLQSKDEINNIIIEVIFECDGAESLKTIAVPIINGKPFGKSDSEHTLSLQDY